MKYWKQCTNRGRVVYDRPTHVFRYTDALRILRQLPVPDLFSDRFLQEFFGVGKGLEELIRKVVEMPEYNLQDALERLFANLGFDGAAELLDGILDGSRRVTETLLRIADRLNIFSWKKGWAMSDSESRQLSSLIISRFRKNYLLLKAWYGPGGLFATENEEVTEEWRKSNETNTPMLPTRHA